MSSRERFEAWWASPERTAYGPMNKTLAYDAWQARDAEVARLVDALRLVVTERITEGILHRIDELLREYDGEKP